MGNMASVVCVPRGQDWHAVAELSGLQDTPHLVQVVRERFPDHHITFYPDASGGSRRTVDASTSDLQIIRNAGYSVRAPRANPPVKDRILAVNAALDKCRVWINDTACKSLAEALEQQAYDKNGMPDKSSGLDHHPDALGYLIHERMPVLRPTTTERPLLF